jgi:hypothetical protein
MITMSFRWMGVFFKAMFRRRRAPRFPSLSQSSHCWRLRALNALGWLRPERHLPISAALTFLPGIEAGNYIFKLAIGPQIRPTMATPGFQPRERTSGFPVHNACVCSKW